MHIDSSAASSAKAAELSPTVAPVAGQSVAPRSRKVWRKGAASLGVVALSIGLAACGGSDDDPAPAPTAPTPTTPAPTPTTPTPPPAASIVPTGFVAAASSPVGSTVYYKDANTNTTLDAGERAISYNATTQHYYELVTAAAAISFADAKTAATLRGGHLFAGADAVEVGFVQTVYGYTAPAAPPAYGGIPVNNSNPSDGAWVGLTLTALGVWTWFTPTGAETGGTAIDATNALWIVRGAGDKEPTGLVGPASPGAEPFVAMTGGNPVTAAPGAATQVLYDTDATSAITRYVVEYETVAAIKNADGSPLTP